MAPEHFGFPSFGTQETAYGGFGAAQIPRSRQRSPNPTSFEDAPTNLGNTSVSAGITGVTPTGMGSMLGDTSPWAALIEQQRELMTALRGDTMEILRNLGIARNTKIPSSNASDVDLNPGTNIPGASTSAGPTTPGINIPELNIGNPTRSGSNSSAHQDHHQ